MEYCSPVWDGVGYGGCDGGSVAQGLLDRKQSRVCVLIKTPSFANQLPLLQLRRAVASLSLRHRHFNVDYSDELHAIITPPLHRDRPEGCAVGS